MFSRQGDVAAAPGPRPASVPAEEQEDYSQIERFPVASKPSRPRSVSPNPRRSIPAGENETEGRPPCPTCGTRPAARPVPRPAPIAYPRVAVTSTRQNMSTPIWAPFARNFAICAPGCQPAQIGIHRPPNGARSCHHSDRAIDVGAMICGGTVYRAINGGRFTQMVTCMRSKMTTLYQQAHKRHLGVTLAHYDHAHFSIGCYGGTFW